MLYLTLPCTHQVLHLTQPWREPPRLFIATPWALLRQNTWPKTLEMSSEQFAHHLVPASGVSVTLKCNPLAIKAFEASSSENRHDPLSLEHPQAPGLPRELDPKLEEQHPTLQGSPATLF